MHTSGTGAAAVAAAVTGVANPDEGVGAGQDPASTAGMDPNEGRFDLTLPAQWSDCCWEREQGSGAAVLGSAAAAAAAAALSGASLAAALASHSAAWIASALSWSVATVAAMGCLSCQEDQRFRMPMAGDRAVEQGSGSRKQENHHCRTRNMCGTCSRKCNLKVPQ